MKTCIVIPTYWGKEKGEEVVFDHPTPLENDGTLHRTLQNLSQFEEIKTGEIKVIIVGVSNHSELKKAVEERLNDYISPFNRYMDVVLKSYSWLEELKTELNLNEEIIELIEPLGYPQVRNLCLIAALESNCDIAIFLDDDELVMDKEFFKTATEDLLEKGPDNGVIHGKAGYYVEKEKQLETVPHWQKTQAMKETFSKLFSNNRRYIATMIALGGNMVMSRELMENIPFDPEITRGEDMDYLFNARLLGYRFYFDKELRIKHLPPEKGTPQWKKTREDIFRFLYSRQKYKEHFNYPEVQKIAFEELMPYPGLFMGDDLEERIYEYCKFMALKSLSKGDTLCAHEWLTNSAIPFDYKTQAVIEKYLERVKLWKALTTSVKEKSM
ncbi:glycosyltransferase family 2 protein [Kosmotoga pacifica]|uniref:Glycosyltransferase 2-like domain-containing protein n=1 Tax=Kosmotoga pacifica TaxID=1330330 RepID=A0A0G2ZCB1_9BACT|nr:glycosyltransferase [Kosmotoga pacifica]AKI97179.1 hypothetical protein IX53_04430 [Kosmotoga pacifica]